jgi:carbon monoxide dehydrogenase subunit G
MPYDAAMYHLTESVRIDRAAAEVWAMLIDFPNVPAWEDGVLEVRQTSPGQPAMGTTFVARRVFGGRETLIDCQIIGWEAGRLVTMEIKGGLVRRASVTHAVEPTSVGACQVTYSTQGEMRALPGMGHAVHPGHGPAAHSRQSRQARTSTR